MGQDLASRAARAEFATAGAIRADLPELGVLVTRLDRGGPSAQAGVQRGDLIVAINGADLQDARDLRDQLQGFHVGDTVNLTIQRDITKMMIVVVLAPFPGDNHLPYLGIYFTARAEEPADL